jgi:hypothetical protein
VSGCGLLRHFAVVFASGPCGDSEGNQHSACVEFSCGHCRILLKIVYTAVAVAGKDSSGDYSRPLISWPIGPD